MRKFGKSGGLDVLVALVQILLDVDDLGFERNRHGSIRRRTGRYVEPFERIGHRAARHCRLLRVRLHGRRRGRRSGNELRHLGAVAVVIGKQFRIDDEIFVTACGQLFVLEFLFLSSKHIFLILIVIFYIIRGSAAALVSFLCAKGLFFRRLLRFLCTCRSLCRLRRFRVIRGRLPVRISVRFCRG